MKVVHALCLGSIAAGTIFFTLKFQMLNDRHYCQLMSMAVIVTALYFLPILYIGWVGYKDAGDSYYGQSGGAKWENAILRFADWFYMILLRTDLGVAGLVISVLIHLQIYAILFVMQWCAWHVKIITKKIKMLKDAGSGTYRGVEMMGDQPEPQVTLYQRKPSRDGPKRMGAFA